MEKIAILANLSIWNGMKMKNYSWSNFRNCTVIFAF